MKEGVSSVEEAHFAERFQKQHPEYAEKEVVWAEQLAELLEHEYENRTGLGTGKSGEVWIGQAPFFEQASCVKTIHDGSASVNTLKREYQLHQEFLAAGVRAPELIGYIEAKGPEGNIGIMAMEAIPGGQTFEQWLTKAQNSGKKIAKSRFDRIMADLKAQIEKAHDAHLYHRDLNWKNVMIDENDRAYIIDFGDAIQALGGDSDHQIYTDELAKNGRVVPVIFNKDEYVLNSITKKAQKRDVLDYAA